jgi:hypothetical protein
MTAYIPIILFMALFWAAILFFVLWPHERKRQLRNAAVGLVVVIGVGAVFWHQCNTNRLSGSEVRKEVTRELPLGSSEEEVKAFVRAQGGFEPDVQQAGSYSVLTDRGVAPETEMLSTIYKDTGAPWDPVNTDIEVFFLLDEKRRLKEVIVPRRNEIDLDDVPDLVSEALTFHIADTVDDVLAAALTS